MGQVFGGAISTSAMALYAQHERRRDYSLGPCTGLGAPVSVRERSLARSASKRLSRAVGSALSSAGRSVYGRGLRLLRFGGWLRRGTKVSKVVKISAHRRRVKNDHENILLWHSAFYDLALGV